ncbi:AraC-like DNA-binding protein [Paenibacillus sp. BK033]|uniref:helix-turn-helix transcriptional regulator n=1 Tax=Paenibacillus sp. BK033 TaxID=2512133 RepID=UPI001052B610|nr:AraC family transcriptional regulator [Paenibacillus sp. BK033]TCM99005.1 AraC-like DNA-binding protein [Paenibacillus sp. BK033]
MNAGQLTGTGTFGFRFTMPEHLALCNLFAIGTDVIRDEHYRWDGWTRNDGPLLLFQYTFDGEGIYERGAETIRIQAGQAFMTEIPGDHRYYFPPGGSHWSFIFVLIRPSLILPNWEEVKKQLGDTPFLPGASRPIRLLQSMYEEAYAGRIKEPYTASSYVYQFISELCRFALSPQDDTREWPIKVKEAVAYIDKHYENMISLDQLADQLSLSKYHLLRQFTKTVGVSPNDYLNQVRIKEAIRLLKESDWSVERIAEQVGYSGGSYFIKWFRKITGETPGNFRQGEGQLVYNRVYFD